MSIEQLIALIVSVGTVLVNVYLAYIQQQKNVSVSAMNMAELNKLVEEQYARLIERKDDRIDELETDLREVNIEITELKNGIETYKQETVLYKRYINHLLDGIKQITGQLTAIKQIPVFVPANMDEYLAEEKR
jgi:chromosome segregation ATPase